MKFTFEEYNKRATDAELLSDLKRVANEHNLTSLSMEKYDELGKYNVSTIIRRFGTWNNALHLVNIDTRHRYYTDQEFLDNIECVWIAKGKQPTRRDMDDKSISNISSGSYLRKYGKWTDALKIFIEYIDNDENEYELESKNDIIKA